MYPDNSNDHIIGSVTIFATLALIASTMLLIAVLLWLAQAIGSLIGALVIIGGISALISLLLYIFSVRPALQRMRQEMAVIYEVAMVMNRGYSWVVQQITQFMR